MPNVVSFQYALPMFTFTATRASVPCSQVRSEPPARHVQLRHAEDRGQSGDGAAREGWARGQRLERGKRL